MTIRGVSVSAWVCGALALGGLVGAAAPARAQGAGSVPVIVQPRAAQRFASLAVRSPRGLTANPATGELIVSTGGGVAGVPSVLLRLDRRGQVAARLDAGPGALVGLSFNPRDSKVYVAIAGLGPGQASRLARIGADFGPGSALEDVALIPDLPAPAKRVDGGPIGGASISFPDNPPFPNGIAFRASDGAAFVSDSLQGAIYRIEDLTRQENLCPSSSSCVKVLLQDGRLSAAIEMIGADGIALSADGRTLFVTNAGEDSILALDPETGSGLRPFLVGPLAGESINFPDGLIQGPGNSLIVVANHTSEIAVLDGASGRILARLGANLGIGADGAPLGLLSPAQVTRLDHTLYVTNFANIGGMPNPGVRVFTIARIELPPALLQRLQRSPAPPAPRTVAPQP
jgi:DNA-binding beta-propeller fold protein YncE